MQGWIKLHRKIMEWDWYKDTSTAFLFYHLLLTANHEPNKWRGILIDTGQLITGRKSLSNDTGLSEQQIRTSLDKLKSTSNITIKSTSKYSIITICNWNLYQDINQQTHIIATSNQPASNHKQELKNDKKEVSKNRGTRFALAQCPDDWLQFCAEKRPDLVPQDVFDAFRDWWISAPGAKGIKLDWTATWRNWVRNQKGTKNAAHSTSTRESKTDRAKAAITRAAEAGGFASRPEREASPSNNALSVFPVT